MTTIILDASSLASKWGFGDGDAICEFLMDNHVFLDCDNREITKTVVRKHLLPLIPNVEVYEIVTHHNPIRCTDEWIEYCKNINICVEVSLDEIVSTIMGRK